jgi:hypothetical protein
MQEFYTLRIICLSLYNLTFEYRNYIVGASNSEQDRVYDKFHEQQLVLLPLPVCAPAGACAGVAGGGGRPKLPYWI